MMKNTILAIALLFISSYSSLHAIDSPVIAITNTGTLTAGGAPITDAGWKALIFSTPVSSSVEITSIELGLNCNKTLYMLSEISCLSPPPVTPYPTTRKLQITIYSLINGVPASQIYSTPLMDVYLTNSRETKTFPIDHWRLESNKSYALLLKSVSSNLENLKWAQTDPDTQPIGLNGFSYNDFATTDNSGTAYTLTGINKSNAVVIKSILIPNVPSLSEGARAITALLLIAVIIRRRKAIG